MIEINKIYIIKREYNRHLCHKSKNRNEIDNTIMINQFIHKLMKYEPNIISIIKSIVETYMYTLEQVATVDDFETLPKGLILYSFNYGVVGFHEGFAREENIRELTNEEREYQKKNHFWKLPQQFYQS